MLSWLFCAILASVVTALAIKIILMKKSMDEICSCIREHLSTDTNRIITVSSRDRHVRRLAKEINIHLKELRKRHRQYVNGDRELKEAITNISHDLRTPLTAICGYLELLETENTNNNVKHYVEQITNRTDALKALTEELFKYTVVSSADLSYEDINVGSLLEKHVNIFLQRL